MKFIVLILVLSIILCSCNKNKGSVKAEIKDLSGLSGCGFIIELENGEQLEPLNLSDYIVNIEDGNKIWVSYHATTSFIATACMVGTIVEIDCASER
tara:strand:+ start:729 stop:1019 length:291 start_codon:yes stop_codon:yes gene_type:complete